MGLSVSGNILGGNVIKLGKFFNITRNIRNLKDYFFIVFRRELTEKSLQFSKGFTNIGK